MKKYLLTLMMTVAAIATMSAQVESTEQTATPVIDLQINVDSLIRVSYDRYETSNYCRDYFEIYSFTAEITNTDDSEATVYYRIISSYQQEEPEWQVYDGWPITIPETDFESFVQIEAYAQAESKLPSEICSEQNYVYGSSITTWIATVYRIDGLYFIKWPESENAYVDDLVTLTSQNPMLGGIYNMNGYDEVPSIYEGDIVVPSKVYWEGQEMTVKNIVCAFNGSKVTSVVLPDTDADICIDREFVGCSQLTSITAQNVTPYSAYRVFDNDIYLYDQVTLFVHAESVEAYRDHEQWGKFTHIVPFLGAGPGDSNGDGVINISDVTTIIDLLLSSEETPDYVDVNGDGIVNISDVTSLIDQLLGGGH